MRFVLNIWFITHVRRARASNKEHNTRSANLFRLGNLWVNGSRAHRPTRCQCDWRHSECVISPKHLNLNEINCIIFDSLQSKWACLCVCVSMISLIEIDRVRPELCAGSRWPYQMHNEKCVANTIRTHRPPRQLQASNVRYSSLMRPTIRSESSYRFDFDMNQAFGFSDASVCVLIRDGITAFHIASSADGVGDYSKCYNAQRVMHACGRKSARHRDPHVCALCTHTYVYEAQNKYI